MKYLLSWPLIAFVLLASPLSAQARLFGVVDNNKIAELNPSTGKVIRAVAIVGDPAKEEGLAFDGTHVYYINGHGLNRIQVYEADLGQPPVNLSVNLPARIDALAAGGGELFVLDFLGNQILVIDLKTSVVVRTLKPSVALVGGMSYGGDRKTLFVSTFDLSTMSKGRILELDPQDGRLLHQFDSSSAPFGLAYSNAQKLLYVASNFKTEAVDPDTGQQVFRFLVGASALAGDEDSAAP